MGDFPTEGSLSGHADIADVDATCTASHDAIMKRLLRGFVFASVLVTLACSNGQASSTSATYKPSEHSKIATAAVPLAGRVTDAAHILSPQERAALSERLAKLEQKTKRQLVVVTVPSLGGRDVADFTRNLANSWGIGRKGYNDGVVLLIAPQERKVRIAVGLGLEKRLPNGICREIIDQEMLPRFREGYLSEGIEAGTDALIAHLE